MADERDLAPASLPAELHAFVTDCHWTYAKTMSAWPHEYIVRERVDEGLFLRMVAHIRRHGRPGPFYRRTMIYYADGGWVYWTMGAPLEETTVINRCRPEQTYAYRAAHGTLPT